ncbi:MAG: YhgE/Pip domain-containing protein, partial [Lachnospiraceae bacterium]|nr:YhgE/Pip domain-containing protein [Lachnospiraceae bacterium]
LKSKADQSASKIDSANASVAETQTTLNNYSVNVNQTMDNIKAQLADVNGIVNDTALQNDINAMTGAASNALENMQAIKTNLVNLQSVVSVQQVTDQELADTITSMVSSSDSMIKNLEGAAAANVASAVAGDSEAVRTALNAALAQTQSDAAALQNQFNGDLTPKINRTLDSLETVLGDASLLMGNVSSMLSGMSDMFGALNDTIGTADSSLETTRDSLALISKRLGEAESKIREASGDERVKVLVDTLTGDPDAYGEFFSEPVQIENNIIYPVENYGSAVAPFYTTLAIWVGALILTAILKVKPQDGAYPDARPYELYLGRYMIFFVVGQLQTLITVLGDIYILHIQCKEPGLFWLASAVTSLTFSLLIYSLVLGFGDVGKALAVVLVVLQIAGSSGTYPIELLPEFFQNVYIFFPFPYAINAMRECIGGMYENNYVLYLVELSVFIFVSLVIGLWIRKPFENLSRFMEDRMEDTEML